MTATPASLIRPLCGVFASVILMGQASIAMGQDVPIVQPGAPGKSSRPLSAEEAIEIANTSYSPTDLRFMQDMIPHHHQAMQMAALVADRTNRPEVIDLAGRIDASQGDEIAFMQQWLRARGERVPEPGAHEAMHTGQATAGMATPEQIAELTRAEGPAFDRLFLELMIAHHEGAVRMVEELLEQPGSAYDPVLFEFTTEVTNDQTAEIERMHALLVGLSSDPRAGLKAGLHDAGQATENMQLLASLPRSPGFFDPRNPAELPPRLLQPDGDPAGQARDDEDPEKQKEKQKDEEDPRRPLLSFSNTDIAFAGDVMVVGSYHGFNIYGLQEDGIPELLSSVVCPGGQGDVSIVGDLLFMSVEEARGRLDCGLQGVSEKVSPERFRGLRIFDIGDLTRPVQVGAVQTCRGSHTHSVVAGPDEDGRIIVYNSGTSTVRDEEEMEGCIGEIPGDERTALFRIDVIEIPVDDPARARIVDSPAVFADPEKGTMAGLWRGGDHGDDTQETSLTDQCHDITVFPERGLAAGACSGNGIIFDISDPLNPQRIDAVVDKGFAYWHSATFNNDGTKVLFTDEWGGGSRPRCRAYDPLTWGANAIYDIVDHRLEFRSYFKLPAPQFEQENCVAHNGSMIPIPGRDVMVQAWYQGGISVFDWTDPSNPTEIAFFDRGPVNAAEMAGGGSWSVYWYNGALISSEISRGLDVFELTPSPFLTQNEIDASKTVEIEYFNVQGQQQFVWPATFAIARAYVDQLERSNGLSAERIAAIREALDGAENASVSDRRETLTSLASELESEAGSSQAANKVRTLARTLRELAPTT